ncbi:hypothetical protein EZV62_007394 [Acer yangbiense]|uniref:Uncharacterized protein n=1 Tax=Acer yangbiense TaxID=1000413 RepID=A0A5C7IBI7_9ROSI|nr:hypothetical protein EZV62_007394 [Acer yangbiense]
MNPPLKAAIAATVAALVVEHCTGLIVLADLLKFNCVVKQEGWGQLYGGLALSLMGTAASQVMSNGIYKALDDRAVVNALYKTLTSLSV